MRITCDCCGYETHDWNGFYCADTPILRANETKSAIEEHNRKRVWVCTPCCGYLMSEILRTRPRAEWQPLLEQARAKLGPGDGAMCEDEE